MSNYIMDMRRLVGHKTIMQCGAGVLIVNEKGQLLLEKRTDNHLWGYAGGSMELDEQAEEAAKRELFEEMGLIADELEFFTVNSGPEAHYIYPNGDEVSNVEIVYLCRKWHGEMKAQEDEVEDLKFFSPEEIDLSTILPPIVPVFRKYLARYGRKDS